MGAEADFGPIERRRELRRLRLQRAMRGIERTPDRRERRADRLDARAQRDEDRGRAELELAEEIRQFRIERNEMEARHRREMAELNERNPRSRERNRERRQERREERRDRMDERLVRAGEAGDRVIRRRDRRMGAEAEFAPRRERRGVRDRIDAGLARLGERADDVIDRRDREAGAEADFRDVNERARQRRERMSAIGERWRELIGVKRRSESDREMENKIIGDVPEEEREDARIEMESEILDVAGIGTSDSNEKEMKAIAKAQSVEAFLDEAEARGLTQEQAEEGLSNLIAAITGNDEREEIEITPELLDVFDDEILDIGSFLADAVFDEENDQYLESLGAQWAGKISAKNPESQRLLARRGIIQMVQALRERREAEEGDSGIFNVEDILDDMLSDPENAEVIEFSMHRLRTRLATLESARDAQKQKLNHALKESGGISYVPVSYTHLTLPTICSV